MIHRNYLFVLHKQESLCTLLCMFKICVSALVVVLSSFVTFVCCVWELGSEETCQIQLSNIISSPLQLILVDIFQRKLWLHTQHVYCWPNCISLPAGMHMKGMSIGMLRYTDPACEGSY